MARDSSPVTTALGAEIIAFYNAWPLGKDWYHEDSIITEDEAGEPCGINPGDLYDVYDALGCLCWQGNDDPPSSIEINGIHVPINDEALDTLDVFRAWRGDKRSYVVVLGPKEASELKEFCAEHGWEVTW